MSNAIRYYYRDEVRGLLPVLHDTYRLIGRYQKNRHYRNELNLLKQFDVIGLALQFFKPLVQGPKQPYFDAILNQELPTSDRIIALDTAVGAMHIEFNVERSYMHQESVALREVLDRCRQAEDDRIGDAPAVEEVLIRGIPASPGVASGAAAIVTGDSGYRRLSFGSIVVTRMTRPEFVVAAEQIAAIVTDIGGSLCHAAIVARELRIPCVVGTGNATTVIHDRMPVSVDGTAGLVTRSDHAIAIPH